MNLRKIIIGLAITAIASFAGLGFQQLDTSSQVFAGAGHWINDTDVG